ncbi:MAG: ABC transporter permease [Azospirillaceae bacterium]
MPSDRAGGEGGLEAAAIEAFTAARRTGWRARLAEAWASDLAHSFRRNPVAIVSALIVIVFFAAAALAPWIAPTNPYDLRTLSIMDNLLPPVWEEGGDPRFLLGTDAQGAGVLSGILYGTRISLIVGFGSVLLSMAIGVSIGIVAGYVGGWLDSLLMRIADIQLTFPAILIALLIGGIAETAVPASERGALAVPVLIFAIGISNWVQYARTVRGSTMVVRQLEYVAAARLIGRSPLAIMARHILPNIMGPVLVIATINLAFAIITEATLSFLGVGMPVTEPSLGMLIRDGNDYLFSGEWWLSVFPSAALVMLALAINLLGDWLRDALNPRLR